MMLPSPISPSSPWSSLFYSLGPGFKLMTYFTVENVANCATAAWALGLQDRRHMSDCFRVLALSRVR